MSGQYNIPQHIITYIISFLSALVLSFLLTPLVKKIAVKKGCVAKPREDRWHKKDTALFGGIAIFVSFIIPYIFCVIFLRPSIETTGIVLCGALMFGLGVFDDIKHIKPYSKLMGQIIIASLLVTFGVSIKIIPYQIISMPLTVLWIVGIVNAFNLLDNMDGLSAGVAAIVGIVLFLCSYLSGNYMVALPALILAGSLLGFLRYNFNPARIFMGDCGSMFIGFMLATITLEGSWEEPTHLVMILGVPLLVLAVPIFDTTFVTVVRRIASHNVFQGGKDHISHRMVVLGLSEKKTVLVFYVISVVFGGISILSMFVRPIVTTIFVLLAALTLIYFAIFLGKVKVYADDDMKKALKRKNENLVLNNVLMHKRRILEVVVDFVLICVAYISAHLLRFEGVLSPENQDIIIKSLPLIVIVKYLVFFKFGLYRGLWRYVSVPDLINILRAVSFSSVISSMLVLLIWRFQGFSRAVFIIDWLLLFMLISGTRIMERIYKEIFDQAGMRGKRVLIYGAGDAGEIALREIKNNRVLGYKPIGFLDDNKHKLGRRIHGIPVLGGRGDIENIVRKHDINEVIIAIPHISEEVFDKISAFCVSLEISYKKMSDILPK
jgi:UDP-GlcNAc:undecaprenyl-phosphate/decaprenyl-phosphate GlcNAc-1-phosphate transferase